MRRILALGAIALVGSVVAPTAASADHACAGALVDAGGLYVVVDDVENAHGGVWIYQESNGSAGLQRDDDSCAAATDENGDPIAGDTVIF